MRIFQFDSCVNCVAAKVLRHVSIIIQWHVYVLLSLIHFLLLIFILEKTAYYIAFFVLLIRNLSLGSNATFIKKIINIYSEPHLIFNLSYQIINYIKILLNWYIIHPIYHEDSWFTQNILNHDLFSHLKSWIIQHTLKIDNSSNLF